MKQWPRIQKNQVRCIILWLNLPLQNADSFLETLPASAAAVEEKSPTTQVNEADAIAADWDVVESVPGQEKVSSSEATTEGAQQGGTYATNHSWSRRSQFKWDINWGGQKYTVLSWDIAVKF